MNRGVLIPFVSGLMFSPELARDIEEGFMS